MRYKLLLLTRCVKCFICSVHPFQLHCERNPRTQYER